MTLPNTVKDSVQREWYARATIQHGWSRNVLIHQIESRLTLRQGKLNVVDDQLRHEQDAPTIGLILCKTQDSVTAEYALRGVDKPLGIASCQLAESLPADLKGQLPSIQELEAELATLTPGGDA